MIRFYVIRLPPTYTFSLVFFFLFFFSKFLFIIYYSSMKSFLNLLSFFLLSYYLWELYKRTCGALLSKRNWGWEWLHSKFQTFINGSDQWPKNLRFCPLHESMDSYNMLTWPRRPIIIGTYINIPDHQQFIWATHPPNSPHHLGRSSAGPGTHYWRANLIFPSHVCSIG